MKKLLYILDDGKRSFTYARIAGFCDAIKNMDEPANLYIFRSAGLAEYEASNNCGEYNIYRLPDFNDFDGIFLDINNYHAGNSNLYGSKGASYVKTVARTSGKPVVSIANKIDGFYYVGIDNHSAMTSVIKYLHEDLKLSSFWFVMGPPDNYENMVRTTALKDYCMGHGLPCSDDRFYAESYAVECGINGFNYLLNRQDGRLPEAVICANDPIANGVIRASMKAGFSIPSDFYVTGFDNLDLAAYLSPTLTTVDQLRWNMGTDCIKVMTDIWKGVPVEENTYTPTKLIKRESTGAHKPAENDIFTRIGESINNEMYTETFNKKLCSLQYRLPGCESILKMCEAFEDVIPSMQCRELYLILDKELYDYGNQIKFDMGTGQIRSNNDGLKTEGYPEEMELIFKWTEDNGAEYPARIVKGIFPLFEDSAGGKDYLFIPLHFMEASVGYMVICRCVDILRTGNISPVINTLTMAMRGFFSGKKLEYLNQMLSGISMNDSLSNMCNRLGYYHLASRLFTQTHNTGGHLAVVFIDIDRMKYFNDTYGHACGDDAIRSVSAAILKNIPSGSIPVRFGGDEFLVIAPVNRQDDIEDMLSRLPSAILAEASERNMPGVPGISSGYVITDPSSSLTLNEYVEKADSLMYSNKRRKRQE